MNATRPMDVGPLSDATRTSTGSDEVAAGAVALEPQAASDREAATEPTTKPFLVTVAFILFPSFHIMHAARGSDRTRRPRCVTPRASRKLPRSLPTCAQALRRPRPPGEGLPGRNPSRVSRGDWCTRNVLIGNEAFRMRRRLTRFLASSLILQSEVSDIAGTNACPRNARSRHVSRQDLPRRVLRGNR